VPLKVGRYSDKTMSLLQTAYLERRSVPDREALQAAIDALAFDCKVDIFYVPFKASGFLPCILSGNNSGFEIYFESATKLLAQFPRLVSTVGNRDVAVTFRWGSDMAECACMLIVSAALAKSFAAVVHYQDDDLIFSADQLVQEARLALAST
jgi:hypothetical protein